MTLLATTFVSIVTLIDRNSFNYSSYITLIDFNSFNYSSYITLIDCKALAKFSKAVMTLGLLNTSELCKEGTVVMYCKKQQLQFLLTKLFIHSFIPDISTVPFQVHYYSEVLPTTALTLCLS